MKPYLYLTDTGNQEANGLRIFVLDLYVDGKITQTWRVNSGQPWAQALRRYHDPLAVSRSYEPIPEGVYNLGPLEFAGGRFDWADSWQDGIGDLWCSINFAEGVTGRSAFGFHLDENRATSPGSAGCVVFRTKADAESWVIAVRKHDPPQLIVDWALGSVSTPGKSTVAKPAASLASVTLDGSPIGRVPIVDGQTLATVPLVAQLLGFSATWDNKRKNVDLSAKKT